MNPACEGCDHEKVKPIECPMVMFPPEKDGKYHCWNWQRRLVEKRSVVPNSDPVLLAPGGQIWH